jgi:hypothetical protein
MNDAQQRYNTDPTFKHVVDLLHTVIRQAQLSPQEVREAGMLAAIHFEIYRPQRWMMQDGEMPRRMSDDKFAAFRMRNAKRATDLLEEIQKPVQPDTFDSSGFARDHLY